MQLPLSAIKPGNNPRGYFDPVEMAELEESIRQNGVEQPILVRPLGENTYEIVAGERRWRASKAVFGENGTIPVFIREMTDEKAETAALIENTVRAAMSPTEEAEAAYKEVKKCNGDLIEAATRLGWKPERLQRRLALMEAVPAVRKALTERKIDLGHAELLAAAPKDKQEKVLEKVIAGNVTVSVLKQQLGSISHNLEAAIFDKTDCGNCPSNSSRQAQMFSEALAVGFCTSPECFNSKTAAQVEAIAAQQREDYPRVEIIKVGSVLEVIPVVADGRIGVGEEQFSACRGCGNYGATVSALPGDEGRIETGVCLDSSCNTSKVAAHLKTLKPEATKPDGAKQTGKVKAAANPNATPTKVKEYRVKVWKNALKAEIGKDAVRAAAALIAIALSSNARCISSSRISVEDGLKGIGRIGEMFSLIASKPRAELSGLLAKLPVAAVDELAERDVCNLLAAMDSVLSEHWTISADYLSLLTKSEIEAAAEEIGLKAAMGESFKKALSGKKDEVIAALLKCDGFAYNGAIPAAMRYDTHANVNVASTNTIDEDSSASALNDGGDNEETES